MFAFSLLWTLMISTICRLVRMRTHVEFSLSCSFLHLLVEILVLPPMANILCCHERDKKNLPPGFRFYPIDEEFITYYLLKKVLDCSFATRAIGEADLNKCEPWHLPGKAKMGEEWYFFRLSDRKYPTGLRTNRAMEADRGG